MRGSLSYFRKFYYLGFFGLFLPGETGKKINLLVIGLGIVDIIYFRPFMKITLI